MLPSSVISLALRNKFFHFIRHLLYEKEKSTFPSALLICYIILSTNAFPSPRRITSSCRLAKHPSWISASSFQYSSLPLCSCVSPTSISPTSVSTQACVNRNAPPDAPSELVSCLESWMICAPVALQFLSATTEWLPPLSYACPVWSSVVSF